MTTPDALYAAILADRHEDTPRLVYADALEEAGDAGRAEFIRVQVALARHHCWKCDDKGTLLGSAGDRGNPECDCGLLALRRRGRELFTHAHAGAWAGLVGYDRHYHDPHHISTAA